MRFILASLILLASSAHTEPRPYMQKPTVNFRALPGKDTNAVNPKVHYVGGYELVAHGTAELMGLSDLHLSVSGDKIQVEAVSDFGAMAQFELTPDGKGGYLDSPLEIDRLRGEDGKDFTHKMFADAEGLTADPVSGERYVSFEGRQRVMRFTPPQMWKGGGAVLPLTGLPLFPANSGMEAVTYVREPAGDSLLIGVESGGFWRCGLKTYACTEVSGPAVPGFLYMMTSLSVVNAGEIGNDHEILALYRYYDPLTGPRNVLRLLRLADGKLSVIGDMAHVTPPLPVDNYEGVAAVKTDAGYRIFLISDSLKDDGKPKLLVFDWTR